MPGNLAAVALWFADEMTGKERDIRTEDRFDQIQYRIQRITLSAINTGGSRKNRPLFDTADTRRSDKQLSDEAHQPGPQPNFRSRRSGG